MSSSGAVGDPHNNTWVVTGAGGGGCGSGPSGWYSVTPTAGNMTFNHATSVVSVNQPASSLTQDVLLNRPGKEPLPLGKTIDAIMERLCIIIPALDKLEKYPALKEAYENYKLVEALIQNDEDKNT